MPLLAVPRPQDWVPDFHVFSTLRNVDNRMTNLGADLAVRITTIGPNNSAATFLRISLVALSISPIYLLTAISLKKAATFIACADLSFKAKVISLCALHASGSILTAFTVFYLGCKFLFPVILIEKSRIEGNQGYNLNALGLTRAPEIPRNPIGEYVDLSSNHLTELPDSYLSLPDNFVIDAQYNLFTPEYVQAFQQRLAAQRAQHPGTGPIVRMSIHDRTNLNTPPRNLNEELSFWLNEYKKSMFQSSADVERVFPNLLLLNDNEKATLGEYLHRLSEVKDYRNGGYSKDNVVTRAYQMLQLANEDQNFRGEMIALMREGLESCGDRVLIVFNDIEILWQSYQDLTANEYRAFAIGVGRYIALKQYAQGLNTADEIETILYFHINLKEKLDLPITTQGMLYPGCSGVRPEMLLDAENYINAMTDEDLLAKSDYWQTYIKKHMSENPIDSINEKYGDLLEQAEKYFNAEDKPTFLNDNESFKELFDRASEGAKGNYNTFSLFLSEERKKEIAKLNV